ncbi:piggyBac transposable element-derived protein 4-like [Metopolophium dirhodum]|uniref:piggyBac transposable element-derived protein 4-like n=1 Tax=Metopolophium dirhodum TaxID=44670 RepID=UPI00298FD452|nr:piggyBac transposable element-derived protein 4-like [Metopolophium dirhodum]
MYSRPKRVKLNDDFINQLLEDSSDSLLSEFDDSDADKTYNPVSSSESDVLSELSDNNEPSTSSNISVASQTWTNVTGNYQKPLQFNNNSGLKIDISVDSTVWDIFNLFLTNEIIDLIVEETNKNAQHFLSKNRLTKSSRFSKWIPADQQEIKKFFGLMIWMGLVQMPTLEDYWSISIRYKNNVAQNTMSRNRFELILRFLHFSDNEKAPNDDRIYKVRDLINKLIENFQKILELEEYLAVDETMVPFRGRLIFRQYIPGKAHKYGVKLFKLCGTNGYTYNVQVYAGKSQVDGKGLGCRVVLDLSQRYLNAGRTIITDHFYTSVPLAYELLKNNTHLVGTLRSNRVKLPEVTKAKLKPNEIVGRENIDGIVIAKWRDKRDVTMLTTRHNINMLEPVKRTRKIKMPTKIPLDKATLMIPTCTGERDVYQFNKACDLACSAVEKDDLPILMKFINTKLFDQTLNVCRYKDTSD